MKHKYFVMHKSVHILIDLLIVNFIYDFCHIYNIFVTFVVYCLKNYVHEIHYYCRFKKLKI